MTADQAGVNYLTAKMSACGFCGESETPEGPKMVQCTACGCGFWCNEEHQRYGSKKHKLRCKTIQGQRERKMSAGPPARPIFDTPVRKSSAGPPVRPQFSDFRERPKPCESPRKASNASSMSSSGYGSAEVEGQGSSNSLASVAEDVVAELAPVLSEIPFPTPHHPPFSRGSPPRVTNSIFSTFSGLTGRSMSFSGPPKIVSNPRFYLPHGENEAMDICEKKDHSNNIPYKVSLEDHCRSLVTQAGCCGMGLNQHQALTLRVQFIGDYVVKSLNEYGWSIVDNFLGENHSMAVLRDVEQLYGKKIFSDGQLMETQSSNLSKWIRSDKIFWFDPNDNRCFESNNVRFLMSMMDSVAACFSNRIPYKIKGRSKAMLACYPANGTRYVKHVDNPAEDGRCISCIYYSNRDWRPEHGGTLRLYPESARGPVDVEPKADRLLFFWSDKRNPHEVLPVYKHRFALTIWYFDSEEKARAMSKVAPAGTAEVETRPLTIVDQSPGGEGLPPRCQTMPSQLRKRSRTELERPSFT